MSDIDHLDLDGRLLAVFLAVARTGSVTVAAEQLGVTQSAVSHALRRLNGIVGEPLFVKRGRGIVATSRALALQPKARELVEQMRGFATLPAFDPGRARISIKIAANDLQRDLVLPTFWQLVSREVEDFRLRVIPSEVPTPELLSTEGCDLILTPYPPEGAAEIFQRHLFKDRYVCFTDGAVRSPPQSKRAYLQAEHVTVVHPTGALLQFDKALAAAGIERKIPVTAPTFAGVSAFLSGTDLVATLPSLLAAHVMRGFTVGDLPISSAAISRQDILPMYLAWHLRTHTDPLHHWLRHKLVLAAGLAVKAAR